MKQFVFFFLGLIMFQSTKGQYWQQAVEYTMEVALDHESATYSGVQKIVYTNNSPETLNKVFYHLYFNAFKPGSEMAVRQKNSADKNTRFKVSIDSLTPKQEGYLRVSGLTQNGVLLNPIDSETILEVPLHASIAPGESAIFELSFEGHVPDVIRRAGKNSREGIAFSMAQWYPKIAEYDREGWNADPYTGREFHGVWGNFDVKITLNKDFMVAASGYLQNAETIGKGYSDRKRAKTKKGKITWHYIAPMVHDFTWAADVDYIHDTYPGPNDVDLHFFYKNDPEIIENWKKLQPHTAELMEYYNSKIGQYPYKQYSVIQGGDGGMEYAMATLITGKRKFGSLFGVTAHEMAHTWFQFLLASNESLHPWMDEGFTTYISNKAENEILKENKKNPHIDSYKGYRTIVTKGYEETLSTHADRYDTNWGYGIASYSKGNIFLSQLEYVIGSENVAKGIKKYFHDFSFKHPTPNDIKRVMEKTSGVHLGWYLNEWTQTTHTIDYGVKAVNEQKITLERIGKMPMPIDVYVIYADGSKGRFNIPLEMMRANKPTTAKILKDWGWASPTYSFEVSKPVKSVIIDKKGLMADIYLENNFFEVK